MQKSNHFSIRFEEATTPEQYTRKCGCTIDHNVVVMCTLCTGHYRKQLLSEIRRIE